MKISNLYTQRKIGEYYPRFRVVNIIHADVNQIPECPFTLHAYSFWVIQYI